MPDSTHTYTIILPHPNQPALFALRSDDGWRLPEITIHDEHRWRDVGLVARAMRGEYALNVSFLRYLLTSDDPQNERHTALCVLENHTSDWQPPMVGAWLEYAACDQIALPDAERASLAAWLANPLPSAERPEWEQPGWYANASTWIDTQFAVQGLNRWGPIDQIRSSFGSCILFASVVGGVVYFKASSPLYRFEPRLTQLLAEDYGDWVPQVLAIEAERGWLLMGGIQGVRLDAYPETAQYIPRWQWLLREVGTMQRDYLDKVGQLLALGVPDLRLETLATTIEPWFASLPTFLGDQAAAFQPLAARLTALCAELAALGLPATLNHGDFHSGNIVADAEGCVLLDWAGFVSVTHPFLGLATIFEEHATPERQAQMLRAYLPPWEQLASPADLQTAARLAVPLGVLLGAMGHSRQLAHATLEWEQSQEIENLLDCLNRMRSMINH